MRKVQTMEALNSHFKLVPEGDLLHYTTIGGFMGIVNGRELWATDLQYMNDTKELKYAGDIVREVILAELKTHEEFEDLKKLFEGGIYNSQYASVFGVSFSGARDLLSQWRGYGGDSGMALCFKPEKLIRIAEANGMRLLKCVYDREQQVKIISEMCDHFVGRLSKMKASGKLDHGSLGAEFLRALSTVGAIVKHPTFADENEWRMVTHAYEMVYEGNLPYHQMGFKEGRSTIVPYFRANLEIDHAVRDHNTKVDLGFHDVLIGPSAVSQLPWRAVMHYLTAKNIGYSQITPSGVPLRGAL